MVTVSDLPDRRDLGAIAFVVEREDGRWWCCPVGGQECCRVSAEVGEWAADAIAWHVQTHHRAWR